MLRELAREKRCPKCGDVKPRTEFYPRPGGRFVIAYCKMCCRTSGRVRSAQFRAENPREARESDLRGLLKSKFGMSIDQFDAMHAEQLGRCAICERKMPRRATGHGRSLMRASVDHDHGTEQIRGLLCTRCNLGLGYFMDDPRLLEKAARYLQHLPFKFSIQEAA